LRAFIRSGFPTMVCATLACPGTWFYNGEEDATRCFMKLADYMHKHAITPGQLRRMLGVKSRSTVLRYISGERTPCDRMLDRICELSGGRVTRKDFLDPGPPKCRRVIVDRNGNPHDVYPWSNPERYRVWKTANTNHPAPLRPGKRQRLQSGEAADPWPSRPLERAINVLGSRVKPARRGGFLLDGRLVDAKRVVEEANRTLKAEGMRPIPYPGVDPLP